MSIIPLNLCFEKIKCNEDEGIEGLFCLGLLANYDEGKLDELMNQK